MVPVTIFFFSDWNGIWVDFPKADKIDIPLMILKSGGCTPGLVWLIIDTAKELLSSKLT